MPSCRTCATAAGVGPKLLCSSRRVASAWLTAPEDEDDDEDPEDEEDPDEPDDDELDDEPPELEDVAPDDELEDEDPLPDPPPVQAASTMQAAARQLGNILGIHLSR